MLRTDLGLLEECRSTDNSTLAVDAERPDLAAHILADAQLNRSADAAVRLVPAGNLVE